MGHFVTSNGTHRVVRRGTTPAAVTEVTAERTAGDVSLSWDSVANAASYLVEASANGGSTWSTLTITDGTTASDEMVAGDVKIYRVTPRGVWGSPLGTHSNSVSYPTGGGGGGTALITPANLTLLGGYRVPPYHNTNPYVSQNSAGVYGGMCAHTFESGELLVWIEHGQNAWQVSESRTTVPMGSAATAYTSWPMLTEANSADKVWSKGELFGSRGGSGYVIPQGMTFDPEGNRLWVSMRSIYATGGDPTQWLAAVDYPSRTVNPTIPVLNISTQRYGGGLGIVPADFANTHFGGRRLAFLSGGYESGQWAQMGPSMAVLPLEPQTNPSVLELMKYLTTAEVGSTPFAQGYMNVAQSFPDYTTTMSWIYPVTAGVGYWPSNSIRCNGAWVETADLRGVLYMAVRGAGNMTYAAQVEGGGAPLRNSLYVYNPDVFAEVAAGTRSVLGIPKQFYEFYDWSSTNNGGISGVRTRSLCWDSGANVLWMYYPRAWTSGATKHPVIAAYSVTPAA